MNNVETKLSDTQLKVFDLIRAAGWEGKTCDELEIETGLSHQSCSARVNELLKKLKLIERRGAMRKTRGGRQAFIYVQTGLVEADKRKQSK